MANIERILIVGGGIAGLTAATALHQQGFAPELIERSAGWPAIGAGIHLPANGVRVLRQLRLHEAVDRVAADVRRWSFFDQQGELLCETDLQDLWREVGPCLGITRVKLQEALLIAAAAVPQRLGVSLEALTQNDSGVEVRFSDGTSGNYDLVVGADGIRSTVRALAIASSPANYAGQVVWRSIIPARPRGMAEMMVLMGEKSFFGVVPMGEGHTYGFGVVDGERFDDPLTGRLDRFRRRFAEFGGPVPAYLSALQSDRDLHFGPIEWVELDEWYRGRVVLIGDAAHAGPPNMGEGGCMAMEDALVLADVLRTANTVTSALEHRFEEVGAVQMRTQQICPAQVRAPEIGTAKIGPR
jgi:2-polyprenyl-6-methoxyphenol hydroxylase-like FAD-dependent oxidoreductase